jgi:transcriptional regulator with XRE-family HTH domain
MPRRNSRDPENDPAAALGESLGLLREAAGITTQEAAAARLHRSHDTVSRWETGAVVPDREALKELLDLYRVDGLVRATIMVAWRLARKFKGPVPEFARRYFEAEAAATFLRFWALFLVPGMLQVPEDAEAMYDLPDMPRDEAAEIVGLRVERQSIITGPDAPHVIAILHEAVLYHLIGSPEVMAGQMGHLLRVMDWPNVAIQVARGKAAYWGLSGGFQVASGPEIPDTIMMLAVDDVPSEEPRITRKALTRFEKVRSYALNVEDTRAAIMEARTHWESQP